MTYFLDFDRTLFDTSAFLRHVIKTRGLADLESKSEKEAAAALNELVEHDTVSFSSGESASFFFPDAQDFIREHMHESAIITAGNPALQRAKCSNALAEFPDLKIFYADYDPKGPFIAHAMHMLPRPWTFVDDKPKELDSVAAEHPHAALYQMCRNGLEPSGHYPSIRSFTELP